MASFSPILAFPRRGKGQVLPSGGVRGGSPNISLDYALDDFKVINDTYGHKTGDQLLIAFTSRLQDACRKSDTVARLSGDEFSVILEEITTPTDVVKIVKKIIILCSKSYKLEKNDVLIKLSLGISLYPEDGINADILLNRADAAMYQAKQQGKNSYQFFNHLGDK